VLAQPLKPDSAIRSGVLPNGMQYVLMHNQTPKGQAAIRLRFGSGSLQETDAQQGLAHFLEHMAFKGSNHVPEGEMVKILQRKGLAFGPDTNAFTAWTQTVYMLDLPETDEDTLDTGLMLMRETASELTLGAKSMEPERGVVLSEERSRDTPNYRAFKAKIQLQLAGQLAARRLPIGQVDVIKTAPVQQLADYYHANYRPERATLILVGDFDVDKVEAKIKARFSDWKPVGPATAEPNLGQLQPHRVETKLMVIPGAANEIELSWLKPYEKLSDTAAQRRADTVNDLALSVLNRRLGKLSRGANPPFLTAYVGFGPFLQSARVATLSTTTAPDHWREGLTAAEQEVRRLVQYGVRQDELQREILDTRTNLVNAVSGASTRRTPDLASEMVEARDDEKVFTSPADDLTLFDASVSGMTPEEVSKAAVRIFSGAGPLVLMNAPAPVEGGDKALSEAYAASAATPVAAPVREAAKIWPYESFGPAGKITATKTEPDLGLTQYSFANGVRLTVKPTKFKLDEVQVKVRIAGGRAVTPPERAKALWAAQAVTLGGLGKITQEDMEQVLNGRTYSAQFAVEDDDFALVGAAKPADLATQLQVLTAYASDTGWRPEAFERLRVAMDAAITQFGATASGVLQRDDQFLLTGKDARFAYPTKAQLAALSPNDLRATFEEPLKTGQIEVVIVGDVTPEQASAAVAATLGALPPRPATSAKLIGLQFPPPAVVEETHTGRADQAAAFQAWPTTDLFANPKAARGLTVLQSLMSYRLVEQVRIAEGAAYSPYGSSQASEVFPGYGLMFDLVETPPDKLDSFFAHVASISADLRNTPASADEVMRAVKPIVERTLKSQQTNEYWLSRLSGSIADPRKLDLIRTSVADYQSITPQDLQALARKYLLDEKAWKLKVTSVNAVAKK
jgi:zinc protease